LNKGFEFPRVSPESVGISSKVLIDLVDALEDCDYCEPHALMVIRHGKVCAEGWWQPFAEGIPHNLWSLGKPIHATSVGIAFTEGLLDLDDKLIDYFPEYADVDKSNYLNELKIRHLLSCSSGKAELRCDTADWRRHYFSIPIDNRPGTKFTYNCEDTNILGGLIEKVSGMSQREFIEKKLFNRLGMDVSRHKWMYLPDGSALGCGALTMPIEDVARVFQLYLNNGVWAGERILNEEYVKLAVSQQIPLTEDFSPLTGYGFQMFLGFGEAFAGMGALGQLALAVPEFDLILLFFQSWDSRNPSSSLEIIITTLFMGIMGNPPTDDPNSYRKLKKRLSTLSLTAPLGKPIPDSVSTIERRRYQVVEGTFTFRNNIWNHATNAEPFYKVQGVECFSFRFPNSRRGSISFVEMGKDVTLEFGLDGTRVENLYALDNTELDRALLDGYFEDDNTLFINARWIETCFSITIQFKFSDDSVTITATHINGDYNAHPLRNEPALAMAAKE